MPVLPLVASTIVVRPGSMMPSASAASIIATPIRSLTEPPGLSISSLANSSAPSGAIRVSWTIGVRPTWSAMLIGIPGIRAVQPIAGPWLDRGAGALACAAGGVRLLSDVRSTPLHGGAPDRGARRRGHVRDAACAASGVVLRPAGAAGPARRLPVARVHPLRPGELVPAAVPTGQRRDPRAH